MQSVIKLNVVMLSVVSPSVKKFNNQTGLGRNYIKLQGFRVNIGQFHTNGKEATVNRALDGSTYPS